MDFENLLFADANAALDGRQARTAVYNGPSARDMLLAAGGDFPKSPRSPGRKSKGKRTLTQAQKEKLAAGKDAARALRQSLYASLGVGERRQFEKLNSEVAQMSPGSKKRAAIRQLWGGAPLYPLKGTGLRGPLNNQILSQVGVNPLLAVQWMNKHMPKGIRSATECAAAVQAGRKASQVARKQEYRARNPYPRSPLSPSQAFALSRAWAKKANEGQKGAAQGLERFMQNYGDVVRQYNPGNRR